ncbi:hypothetical protein FB565_002863 [Actinoplanes lutulentus]|uniref:Uncharacterized protein n=1 Tax=Actinoplanes lutulentus TaxID=1287878 RepID=A0A327YWM0_9ACTN|nr:hypothetical protein [Actinoplanes lutulentus]RAK25555.1 hypothetical protein B0I29_13217 [Actinoplanes lutulentus]
MFTIGFRTDIPHSQRPQTACRLEVQSPPEIDTQNPLRPAARPTPPAEHRSRQGNAAVRAPRVGRATPLAGATPLAVRAGRSGPALVGGPALSGVRPCRGSGVVGGPAWSVPQFVVAERRAVAQPWNGAAITCPNYGSRLSAVAQPPYERPMTCPSYGSPTGRRDPPAGTSSSRHGQQPTRPAVETSGGRVRLALDLSRHAPGRPPLRVDFGCVSNPESTHSR